MKQKWHVKGHWRLTPVGFTWIMTDPRRGKGIQLIAFPRNWIAVRPV